MSLPEAVNGQVAEPSGFGGGLAGLMMLHRPSNRARARWVLSLTGIQSSDKVLDVGIGPGYSTGLIAASLGQGVVVGVDRSAVMMSIAQRRLARYMKTRTVMLLQADLMDLPNFNIRFDKVVSINTLQIHAGANAELAKLHSRMAPGGCIAIAIQPNERGVAASQAFAVHMTDSIRAAGFERLQTHFNASLSKTPCVCVVARAC